MSDIFERIEQVMIDDGCEPPVPFMNTSDALELVYRYIQKLRAVVDAADRYVGDSAANTVEMIKAIKNIRDKDC